MAAVTPSSEPDRPAEHYWLWVLCLLGLDYFSTLAYQPSITFGVAGRVGPLATAVVTLVTLAGALPVYFFLAGRASGGGSAIGMLADVVRGWRGKTAVLVLLGFAATDFTMLKTISLADAAAHVLGSRDAGWTPFVHEFVTWLRGALATHMSEESAAHMTPQLLTTLLLGALAFLFWFFLRKGFNQNVVRLAVPIVVGYLALNAIVLIQGGWRLAEHPELVTHWLDQVRAGDWQIDHSYRVGNGWGSVALLSVLFLPNLALGLSGFEMSMVLMPQVRGRDGEQEPRTRIRNTRKVLVLAALIMSVYLLGSAFVTTLLIPPEEFGAGGQAADRALAYLAHGRRVLGNDASPLPWCGPWFGSLYDLVTVLMLVLAGSSVMTVLAVLLPRFLLRFGMEMAWVHRWGALLAFFALVNLAVTVYFQASVDAQRNAYAIGVLVLISCACVVSYLEHRRQRETLGGIGRRLAEWFFGGVCLIFLLITLVVALRSGSGLLISGLFILTILTLSVISRAMRANEMRTLGFVFRDAQSEAEWKRLCLIDFPALVPHRPGRDSRDEKEAQIRAEHQLDPDMEVVFLEVHKDDPSDFYQTPLVEVAREGRRDVLRLTRCVSVAHAIAAVALEMSRSSKPPILHFGWPELNLLVASWSYFAFGEGNIPWKVRELIALVEPDPAKRPRVIVG